jgi:cell division protein FtsW (lipid II flippase)
VFKLKVTNQCVYVYGAGGQENRQRQEWSLKQVAQFVNIIFTLLLVVTPADFMLLSIVVVVYILLLCVVVIYLHFFANIRGGMLWCSDICCPGELHIFGGVSRHRRHVTRGRS